jgi:hypothetical protein
MTAYSGVTVHKSAAYGNFKVVEVLSLFCHVQISSYVSLSANSSASIDTERPCDRCPLQPFPCDSLLLHRRF